MLQSPPPTDSGLAAHERVYRALRSRIMYGELDPGVALTIRGIGAEFGVSMTPAREAVRRLAAEGALSLSATGRVSTPELTPERIEELAALRALLEPELASRALPRAHMALIERLQGTQRLGTAKNAPANPRRAGRWRRTGPAPRHAHGCDARATNADNIKKAGNTPAFALYQITSGSDRRHRPAPLRARPRRRSGGRGRCGRGLLPPHQIPSPCRLRGSIRPPPGR